jgi:predicted alpha/beta hydrolase family esterase
MSAQVFFVQGGGRGAHDAWDSKLVASLKKELGRGYSVRYPRMPGEANPDTAAWKRAIARELRKLSDEVILIGHSIGAAILFDYLADGGQGGRPAAIFLISNPFIGDEGWPSEELRPTKDAATDLPKGVPIYVYHGTADGTVPVSHLEMFAKALPGAIVRRLEGRDHQLNGDLSELAHDIKRLERAPGRHSHARS